jgi:preprotein translocase subunit SecA
MSRLRGEGIAWGYENLMPRLRRIREIMDKADEAELASREGALEYQDQALARAGIWCRDVLGLAVHDNQFAAALYMAEGHAVQLPTGEGKTIAGAMAACLIALGGRNVMSLTINDYLANRDHEWMSGLYDSLGISHGCVQSFTTPAERRSVYGRRICHACAREAGFDHLKDLTALSAQELLNPSRQAVLLDEADVILLDEARLPLVLAGPEEYDSVDLEKVRDAVEALEPFHDIEFSDGGRKVIPSLRGQARLCRVLGLRGPHEDAERPLWARIHAALHARFLVERDRDYVLYASGPDHAGKEDGLSRVGIVDEVSGRIAPSRRWPWGVQAAVEAREGAHRSREGEVLVSVTMERFILGFPFRCGMSASLEDSAAELYSVYGLDVRVLEPHRPCVRVDLVDRLFDTEANKWRALTGRVAAAHSKGQPVLIGTASVRESEALGRMLESRGLSCQVLNAAKADEEAAIIARAGDPGRITVSTNMAGRGTDIRLAASFSPESREFKTAWESGGLLVLGVCRAESQRMDAQLRGRAGRQGEPGESQFYLSLEDPFFRKYGIRDYLTPPMLASARTEERQGAAPGEFLDPAVLGEFQRSQRIIHMRNDESRETLRNYEAVLDVQYRRFGQNRAEVLGDESLADAQKRELLLAMDRAWADHLARGDDLRQGVHLNIYGGRDPWREYLRITGSYFDAMMEELLGADGIEAETGRPIARPDQRWTYAIEENLLPSWQLGKAPGSLASLGKFLSLPFKRLLKIR